MIDTTKMDADEIRDLFYDIRDGWIKEEEVNWPITEKSVEMQFRNGDIVLLDKQIFVVIDYNKNINAIFVSQPNTYLATTLSKNATWGIFNSGWENIEKYNQIKIVGHIDLNKKDIHGY